MNSRTLPKLAITLLFILSIFAFHAPVVSAQGANGIFNLPPVASGPLDIFGVAHHEAFRKWQLDILIDGDAKQATFVAVGENPLPELSKLTTINTSRYPDGKHTLRLRVAYTGLQYDEFFALVTITNSGSVADTLIPDETIPDESIPNETIAGETGAEIALQIKPELAKVPPVVYDPDNYFRTLEVGSGYQPSQAISRSAKRSEIEVAQALDVVQLKTDVPTGTRRIEIDLSEQKLIAYQGDTPVMITQVSTGRKNGNDPLVYYTETVTGSYRIQKRYAATRMIGPGYDTSNVPYAQFFFRGYAIHGAYWHNEFGMPVSHGCINMRVEEARQLFEWADIGTEIIVSE